MMKFLTIAVCAFTVVSRCDVSPVVVDGGEASVVHTAVELFADDVRKITDRTPSVCSAPEGNGPVVLVGTLGVSPWVDSLVSAGLLDVSSVAGKWEAYGIKIVKSPFDGVPKALVVYGNDPRGTAYGLMELTRRMGISPWSWWADVFPRKKNRITFGSDINTISSPSVKYRGIFLNDEDWGLQPWAASKMDTEIQDIGPRTYEKIFELLLRHKANILWPAMHVCTHAFFSYPGNAEVAEKYGIVIGSSHCEPMLRNNVDEWKEEYGEYDWSTNRDKVISYWKERVDATSDGDYCYTLGMRGVHDSPMVGYDGMDAKVSAMNDIISVQRSLLESSGRDLRETPQVYCPYKEALVLYRHGLQLPEDVTLLWVDDNYGYVRQVGTLQEQARSGGAGVYYHFSYWGNPDDYLWLATTPPALTVYELTKAWNQGCRNMWIFNVGDIKPAEYEMQYALDFAWDMTSIDPFDADSYALRWAEENFGKHHARETAAIKAEYYRLNSKIKPEHLVTASFDKAFADRFISDFDALEKRTEILYGKIPADRKDAFYQLMMYPVASSCQMARKTIYAHLGRMVEAESAYMTIIELTRKYNELSDGKWDGIMTHAPRNRPRFLEPQNIMATPPRWRVHLGGEDLVIPADRYSSKTNDLQVIKGLGSEGSTVSHVPFDEAGGQISYEIPLKKGENHISVRCLPTFPLYGGYDLRLAASLDGEKVMTRSIATEEYDKRWYENILRNYTDATFVINAEADRNAVLEIDFIDPALAVTAIIIDYR